MIKPFKILIFLVSVLLLLLCIAWFAPSEGYKLGNFTLRYPNIKSIQEKLIGSFAVKKDSITNQNATTNVAKIDSFPKKYEIRDSIDSISVPASDTIAIDEQPIQIEDETLKTKVIPIEFADSSHNALLSFFTALKNKKTKTEQVRVFHFGDSQIEGDRITMFIRSALQDTFGGKGVGIVPAYPQSYQPANISHSVSGEWTYTSLLDGGNKVSKYGLFGGITEIKNCDSKESIKFTKYGKPNRNCQFSKVRVFYGQNDSTYLMQLKVNNDFTDAETLAPQKSISQQSFSVPILAKEVELQFSGKGALLLYGISLESDNGIYVDNIPQRGNSGTVFTKFDFDFSHQLFNQLNAKLVILQYGVNVVPANLNSYAYYEEILYRQIKAIKSFKPDVSVLLIGVSDMSRKLDDKFVSYPNIEKVRNAQRNAAFRAGAAFWDCYEAMGGKNSMPAWVYSQPPLASKDFTHFNFRGSKLIANLFVTALLSEYKKFINTKETLPEGPIASEKVKATNISNANAKQSE